MDRKDAIEIVLSLLGGTGIGASLMYLLDPVTGAKHRQQLKHAVGMNGNGHARGDGHGGLQAAWQSTKDATTTAGAKVAEWATGLAALGELLFGRAEGDDKGESREHRRRKQRGDDPRGERERRGREESRDRARREPAVKEAEEDHESGGGLSLPVVALGAFALGAGVIYLTDPDRGRQRRHRMRDKGYSKLRQGRDAAAAKGRYVRDRAKGVAVEGVKAVRHEEVPDATLEERVRAQMGHAVTDASTVQVRCEQGRVTLTGTIPVAEVDALLSAVYRIPGVEDLINQLDVRESDRDDTAEARAEAGAIVGEGEWTAGLRVMKGMGGAALVLWGLRRRDALGIAAGMAGAGLVTRAVTSQS